MVKFFERMTKFIEPHVRGKLARAIRSEYLFDSPMTIDIYVKVDSLTLK